MEQLMTAGACFAEPDEGDLRLAWKVLTHFLPRSPSADESGNVYAPGVMVQEYGPRYSKDGHELCGGGVWRNVCPLVDYPELYPHGVLGLPSLRQAA
jgi:hypothetical protein